MTMRVSTLGLLTNFRRIDLTHSKSLHPKCNICDNKYDFFVIITPHNIGGVRLYSLFDELHAHYKYQFLQCNLLTLSCTIGILSYTFLPENSPRFCESKPATGIDVPVPRRLWNN